MMTTSCGQGLVIFRSLRDAQQEGFHHFDFDVRQELHLVRKEVRRERRCWMLAYAHPDSSAGDAR